MDDLEKTAIKQGAISIPRIVDRQVTRRFNIADFTFESLVPLVRTRDVVRLAPTLYHLLLAVFYGSPLDVWYSDPKWYVGTGLTIAGVEGVIEPRDQPPVLPLFIALIYRLFGFPDFARFLWIWNAVTMLLLVVGTYQVIEYFFDERTACIATLMVGFNWHVGWYGQMLLVDTTVVSMMFLTLSAFIKYQKSQQRRYLFLVGVLAAVTMWTKLVAIALFLPVIAILLYKSVRERTKLVDFILGFLFGQFLFTKSISTYSEPIEPILVQAGSRLNFLVSRILNGG